jgi:cyanophycinase
MKRWHSTPAALVILVCLHACTPSDAPVDETATPPGRLVIIGGGLQSDNAGVYQAIVEGRQGDGPLCVVPTASGDPAASMESARETLTSYAGADAVIGIPLSTEDPSLAEDPAVVADLASCSGFYFTGGSQTRVVDVFLPEGDTTAAYRALWARWQEGAVMSGSSAGAAMMSSVMIAGGSSTEAVANGVADSPDGDGVDIRAGMGFFDRAMVDQHFLARGRIGRLLVAVLATDSLPLGLGIDENTALVVDGDTAFVAGASGVVVVDGRQAERTGTHLGSGLRVSLAGAGDAVDLRTFEVRRSGAKGALPPTGGALEPPENPFDRWAFLHLMVDLASSPDRGAVFSTEGATLRIDEGEGFSAVMAAAEGGVEGTPAGISAGPFLVDLLPGG